MTGWIDFGLLIVTIAAVVVSIWQAAIARKARIDAQAASALAGNHEAAALQAAERSAAALERQAAIAEATANPPDPWLFEPESDASMDQRWRVINNMREDVVDAFLAPSVDSEDWIMPDGNSAVHVASRGSLGFTFLHRLSSPTRATVLVHWTPADGTERRQFIKSIP